MTTSTVTITASSRPGYSQPEPTLQNAPHPGPQQQTGYNAQPGYNAPGGYPYWPPPPQGIPTPAPNMPFMSPPIALQPIGPTAGAFVSPGTAVLAILVIAGIYWCFKNMSAWDIEGIIGGGSASASSSAAAAPSADEKSSSKSSSKDKDKDKATADTPSLPSMPSISPAAFISLFTFALFAAVMIQGPLGLNDAFSGKQPLQLAGSAPMADNSGGVTGNNALLQLLPKLFGTPNVAGFASGGTQQQTGTQPQMAGRGQTGPNGVAQWDWFVNPLPAWTGQQPQVQAGQQAPLNGRADTVSGLSPADAIAFTMLPPLLQAVPFCTSSPGICSTLLANLDIAELTRVVAPFVGPDVDPNSLLALLSRQTTAQPKPIPLIPAKGYLGSINGLQNIENAFYPMLIGAIGLIVLFDYGT